MNKKHPLGDFLFIINFTIGSEPVRLFQEGKKKKIYFLFLTAAENYRHEVPIPVGTTKINKYPSGYFFVLPGKATEGVAVAARVVIAWV